MPRKIIQIAFDSDIQGDLDNINGSSTLFALCDDGTIWYENRVIPDKWERYSMDPIPQDKDKDKDKEKQNA